MGTSSSFRSPKTPAWERVHRLYDDPHAPPEAIVSRIVTALAAGTREAMGDPAVARSLGTLTGAGAGALEVASGLPASGLPAAWDLAAMLRRHAEDEIIRAREASRFGEIGLDALGAAALEVGEGAEGAPEAVRAALRAYGDERRLSELASLFMSSDVAFAFRYFVERDTPSHVGGPRLKTVGDAQQLADQIAGLCSDTTRGLPLGGLEDDLWRAAEASGEPGHSVYRGVLKSALGDSLQALGGIGQ